MQAKQTGTTSKTPLCPVLLHGTCELLLCFALKDARHDPIPGSSADRLQAAAAQEVQAEQDTQQFLRHAARTQVRAVCPLIPARVSCCRARY